MRLTVGEGFTPSRGDKPRPYGCGGASGTRPTPKKGTPERSGFKPFWRGFR